MTVPHGDIAQTASTYGTGNGGVAQEGDDGDGGPQDQGGDCLRQVDLPDDLEPGGSHGLGGLHHAGVHLGQGGLHHAGDEGGGRDHQGHDGAQNPQFGAHDDLGKGHDGYHEDDEGQGTAHVDDPAQHPVEPFVGPDAMGLGDTQENPQGQADDIGEEGGDPRHN